MHYGKPLAVRVKEGRLVIEIGTHVLAHACTYADWANPFDEEADDYIRTFAVTDAEQFAMRSRKSDSGVEPSSRSCNIACSTSLVTGCTRRWLDWYRAPCSLRPQPRRRPNEVFRPETDRRIAV